MGFCIGNDYSVGAKCSFFEALDPLSHTTKYKFCQVQEAVTFN